MPGPIQNRWCDTYGLPRPGGVERDQDIYFSKGRSAVVEYRPGGDDPDRPWRVIYVGEKWNWNAVPRSYPPPRYPSRKAAKDAVKARVRVRLYEN